MQQLQETDPEFFKFLQENDAGLLDFDGASEDDEDMDDLEEIEEGSEDDEEMDEDQVSDDAMDSDSDEEIPTKPKKQAPIVETTKPLIDDLLKAAHEGSNAAFKKLMSIFRAACIPADAEEEARSRFLVNSPEIYEYAMVSVLENAFVCFYKHLGVDTKPNATIAAALAANPKWKSIQLLVLSFFKSVMHTLQSLLDGQQSQVTTYLLTSLEPYIALLAPLPRLAKQFLKVLLRIWSSTTNENTTICGYSFLRIRQMALVLPGNLPEECFRGIYLTYARTCKIFTELNSSAVLMMAQSVTELYLSNTSLAYQHAFLYIRQLALHLRTAIIKKTPESYKQILNWQFLNCVRLWTRVLCAMPHEDALGPLIFPLSQVMLGVISIATAAIYIPMKFHLIVCMQQLAAHGEMFIPTSSKLVEILEVSDLTGKPVPSTELPPKLEFCVKFTADSTGKPAIRDLILAETITLLKLDAEIYRYHVGFPEYVYLIIRKLKTFIKKCKTPKWRDLARALANQYEQMSSFVKIERVKLSTPPMDIKEFEPLKAKNVPRAAVRLQALLKDRGLHSNSEIVVNLQSSETTPTEESDEESVEEAEEEVQVKVPKKKEKKSKKKKEAIATEEDVMDMDDQVGELSWMDDDSADSD